MNYEFKQLYESVMGEIEEYTLAIIMKGKFEPRFKYPTQTRKGPVDPIRWLEVTRWSVQRQYQAIIGYLYLCETHMPEKYLGNDFNG